MKKYADIDLTIILQIKEWIFIFFFSKQKILKNLRFRLNDVHLTSKQRQTNLTKPKQPHTIKVLILVNK